MKKIAGVFVAIIITLFGGNINIIKTQAASSSLTPIQQNQVRNIIELYLRTNYGVDVGYGDYIAPQKIWNYIDDQNNLQNARINDIANQLSTQQGASRDEINNVNNNINGVNNNINEVKDAVNNINVEQGVANYFEKEAESEEVKKVNNDSKEQMFNLAAGFIRVTNSLWSNIGKMLKGASDGNFEYYAGEINPVNLTLNISDYGQDTINGTATGTYHIIKIFAYGLLLLFFSCSLVETTVKYEMVTFKGIITIVGRFVGAKLLVDNAGTICIKIMKIILEVVSKLVDNSTTASFIDQSKLKNLFYTACPNKTVPIIGPIVNFLFALVILIPFVLTVILMIITFFAIMIKITLWSVDMAVLVATSPMYIACWASDVTKQYFRSFIVSFIQCTAQLLYMSIVYSIFKSFLNQYTVAYNGFEEYLLSFAPISLITIAMAILMVKPPKVLSNLLR